MSLPLKKRNIVTPPATNRKDSAMTTSPGGNAQQIQVAFARKAYKQATSDARKALLRAVDETSSSDRALAMQLDCGFASFIQDIALAQRQKDPTTKVPTIARHPGAPTTPGAQKLVSEFSSYQEVLNSARKDLKNALVAASTSTDVREDEQSRSDDGDGEDGFSSALYFLDTTLQERKSSDASISTADLGSVKNTAVSRRTNVVGIADSPDIPQVKTASVPKEIQPCNTDVLCVESHQYDDHYGNQILAYLIANESTSLHHASSHEVDELSGNVTNAAYKIISQLKSQGGRFLLKSGDGSWSIASDSDIINMISRSILYSIIEAEDFDVDGLKKQNSMLEEVAQENKRIHAELNEVTTLKQKLSAEEALSRKRAKHESEQEDHIATLERQLEANKILVREQAKQVSSLRKLNETLEDTLNNEKSLVKQHVDYEYGQNGRIAFLENEVDYYRTAYSCEYYLNEQSKRERYLNVQYWQSVGAPAHGTALVYKFGPKEQTEEGSGDTSKANSLPK